MTRTMKTEVIVLKKKGLLNKDLIITLFSQDLGKISVFAKGIKKITSKRLPHTETGNLLQIIIYKKNERFYLQDTQLISAFSQIKKDQQKVSTLYFFFFILERLLPENQKEAPVYTMTKKILIKLSRSNFTINNITDYLNELIQLLGYSKDHKSIGELVEIIEEVINEKVPSLII